MIRDLVKKGARINVQDKFGNTLIHLLVFKINKGMFISTFQRHLESIKTCKSLGMELNILNYKNETPLDLIKSVFSIYHKNLLEIGLKHHKKEVDLSFYDLYSP